MRLTPRGLCGLRVFVCIGLGGWFQGNETTTSCRYLEWKYSDVSGGEITDDANPAYARAIYRALRATNDLPSAMFNAALRLTFDERETVISCLTCWKFINHGQK